MDDLSTPFRPRNRASLLLIHYLCLQEIGVASILYLFFEIEIPHYLSLLDFSLLSFFFLNTNRGVIIHLDKLLKKKKQNT